MNSRLGERDNIYYNPEMFGLEMVGEVNWSEPDFSFDFTAVWRDRETGQLYWGHDSGCSCPQPFEDIRSRDDLDTGTSAGLSAALAGAFAENGSFYAREIPRIEGEIAELMLKVNS